MHISTLVELENRCQERGMRSSANLRDILEGLVSGPDHPDAETLHQWLRSQGKRISLTTVYRNLAHLVAAGVVSAHHFGSAKARFEVAETHDHLIDVSTGKIIEFSDGHLNALEEKIAAEMGYRILRRRVELYAEPIERAI